MICILYNMGP